MLKILPTLLAIMSILTFTTCEKNTCQNCYPTIFECKVDGKTWKTSCESKDLFGCSALDVQLYSNSISIVAKNNDKDEIIKLIVKENIGEGIFNLYDGPNDIYTILFSSNFGSCREKRIDSSLKNSFVITKLDTVNQILQGTFEFTTLNPCGKEIKVTAGKVDVIYRN